MNNEQRSQTGYGAMYPLLGASNYNFSTPAPPAYQNTPTPDSHLNPAPKEPLDRAPEGPIQHPVYIIVLIFRDKISNCAIISLSTPVHGWIKGF